MDDIQANVDGQKLLPRPVVPLALGRIEGEMVQLGHDLEQLPEQLGQQALYNDNEHQLRLLQLQQANHVQHQRAIVQVQPAWAQRLGDIRNDWNILDAFNAERLHEHQQLPPARGADPAYQR